MIRAIRTRDCDERLVHWLSHESAAWEDLEDRGRKFAGVTEARNYLAANGGGWLWFADDDDGRLRISHVDPDRNNPRNWPDDEGIWP